MTFSANLLTDIQQIWHLEFMQHAFEAGTVIAIVAGIMGYFVVLRRSAFVAHAFSEIGFAGAAGAVLVDVAPIWGLLLGSISGGFAIAALGRRVTNRDTQIGIVLAFALGLGLLFIRLYPGYANESYSILFGEIVGISWGGVLQTLFFGLVILAGISLIYRPLLFASLDEDVAEAKGMPMVFLGMVFMLLVAVAVSIAVQMVGVLLIFSLMVTPAATAQYLAKRPQRAIMISVLIALAATWSGLFIGFYEPYPVSFFITSIAFVAYLAVRAWDWKSPKRIKPGGVPKTGFQKSRSSKADRQTTSLGSGSS
ncbi:MAG: metal ABC transporter permease [Nitrososphaerales archaeon]|jgi:zinc/manganese transport system permease protein